MTDSHASDLKCVAGLDLAAGRGRSALAALAFDPSSGRPRYQPHAHAQPLAADDEIVDAVRIVRPAMLAIDAPLSLPGPVAAALGVPGSPPLASLPEGASPYTRAAERDPLWRRRGVRPLPVSFLGGLTFRAIALLPRLRAAVPETTIIEAFPSGALAALGIARNEPTGGPRRAKTTLSSRMAVQAGLQRFVVGLPDPALTPLDADELDALAAALTALAYVNGMYDTAGDSVEGEIVVPKLAHLVTDHE